MGCYIERLGFEVALTPASPQAWLALAFCTLLRRRSSVRSGFGRRLFDHALWRLGSERSSRLFSWGIALTLRILPALFHWSGALRRNGGFLADGLFQGNEVLVGSSCLGML